MLFNPERASRLITLKARDKSNQPGLTYVMNEVINKTILKEMTDKNTDRQTTMVCVTQYMLPQLQDIIFFHFSKHVTMPKIGMPPDDFREIIGGLP